MADSYLVNLAEDLAADAFLARLASGHHALGRGQNADPQAAEHARNLGMPDIHAATGPRDALQVRDGRRIVGAVFQVHAQDPAALFLGRLEVRDVALFLQNAGHLDLELGVGNVHLLVARLDGVTNTRQKIRNRVGQTHALRLLKSSPVSLQSLGSALTSGIQRAPLSRSSGKCKNQPRRTTNSAIRVPHLRNCRLTEGRVVPYQEDFATPGISPRNASPRKHRRQRPNLRRYARGRPQILQRLCWRLENFGLRASLTRFAVVDIRLP